MKTFKFDENKIQETGLSEINTNIPIVNYSQSHGGLNDNITPIHSGHHHHHHHHHHHNNHPNINCLIQSPSQMSKITGLSGLTNAERLQQLEPEPSATQMTPTPSPSAPNFEQYLTSSSFSLNPQTGINVNVSHPSPLDNLDLSNCQTDSNQSLPPLITLQNVASQSNPVPTTVPLRSAPNSNANITPTPQMILNTATNRAQTQNINDNGQSQRFHRSGSRHGQQKQNRYKRYRRKGSSTRKIHDEVDEEMAIRHRANATTNNTNYNNHHYQKPRLHHYQVRSQGNGKNVKIGATIRHPYRVQNYHGHGHMTHTNNNNNNNNNNMKKIHNHSHRRRGIVVGPATALKATQSTPHNISYGNNTILNNKLLEKPPTPSIKSLGSVYSMETQTSISRSCNELRSNNGQIMHIDEEEKKRGDNMDNVKQNYGTYTPPKMTTATTTGNPNIKVDISGNFGVSKDRPARDKLNGLKVKLTPTSSTPMKPSPNHNGHHPHHNSFNAITWQAYIGHFVFNQHDRGHSLYHQFKKIGEGVFARVYKTVRKEPQRTVALKVFPV